MSMWTTCSLQAIAPSMTQSSKQSRMLGRRVNQSDLGPNPDWVPALRFLGMNLERVDAERSTELNPPVGPILLNQMEYIIEVLMKFEPSLQLKTRTTLGNQESFATRPTTSFPTNAEHAEYHEALQVLAQDEIVEIDALEKKNTKLYYNSEQNLINLPESLWLSKLDSITNQTRHCMGQEVERQV